MSKPTRQDVFAFNGETYDTMHDMVQAMAQVAKATKQVQTGTDTVTITPVVVDPPPPPPNGQNIGVVQPDDPSYKPPSDA